MTRASARAAIAPFEWPVDGSDEALRALATAEAWPVPPRPASASASRDAASPRTRATHAKPSDGGFVDSARAVRLDVDLVDIPARDPLATLRRLSPLVLNVPGLAGPLVVRACGRRTAVLIGPQGPGSIAISALEDVLWAPFEAGAAIGAEVGRDATAGVGVGADVRVNVEVGVGVGADARGNVEVGVGVGGATTTPRVPQLRLPSSATAILGAGAAAAGRVLLQPALAGRPLAEAWTVRRISGGLGDELRRAHALPRFAAVVAVFIVQFALFVGIWSQVGARVLAPAATGVAHPTRGWAPFVAFLAAWVIAQLVASAAIGRLGLDVGEAVRVWLLRGALRLGAGRMRSAGVGQLLGRALDAEALDVLALGGGVQAVLGIFELGLGALVLSLGAAAGWSWLALGLTMIGLALAVRLHARRLFVWSATRRALTHDLVERMVGHRTVLVQDRPDQRRADDDRALEGYDRETRALDRAAALVAVGLPRGWLVLGLVALAPRVWGHPADAGIVSGAAIAMSVGGVWLVYSALRRLGAALPLLSTAWEAWGRIQPLIGVADDDAANIVEDRGAPAVPAATGALIEAEGIGYQYPGRPTPVLNGVTLAIARGDRLLIQGASGGGKSTLAALLTGLAVPNAGRLRLHGVDQRSVGLDDWRRSVGAAPQFHDNHVFGATLLFNLLMGRRWPPRLEDLADAERVCRDLGLGPLLERMPAGLQQQVGETGWQLSHGERSRLFVARSLLQVLDARVLDESFAALDPETLDQVMDVVLRRPEALIVIAHP